MGARLAPLSTNIFQQIDFHRLMWNEKVIMMQLFLLSCRTIYFNYFVNPHVMPNSQILSNGFLYQDYSYCVFITYYCELL